MIIDHNKKSENWLPSTLDTSGTVYGFELKFLGLSNDNETYLWTQFQPNNYGIWFFYTCPAIGRESSKTVITRERQFIGTNPLTVLLVSSSPTYGQNKSAIVINSWECSLVRIIYILSPLYDFGINVFIHSLDWILTLIQINKQITYLYL